MSWEYKIEVPHVIAVNGEHIEVGTFTAIVECEPDETLGDTDWYISGVAIDGLLINPMVRGNPRDKNVSRHWLAKSHPLYDQIAHHAYTHYAKQLEAIWQNELNDRPRSYARSGSGWALP